MQFHEPENTLMSCFSLSQLSQFSIRSSRFEPERRGERATKQCQEIESLKKLHAAAAQLSYASGAVAPFGWISPDPQTLDPQTLDL